MGGKKQRTKNNVRPSSSGRSAELLSGVSVEGGRGGGALFPALAAPLLDPLLTPHLQLCFKKLSKKDPITKTKALQELSELVPQSKVDDIVAALSSWSHYYKILSIDSDRKVRELTQLCHERVLVACGRRAAPALRALLPPWLRAQHDDHAPTRTHAQRSLQTIFPESKLPEVLSFCKDEVVSYLLDNLTAFDENADCLVASSLRGLQVVVARLPRDHNAWLWERLDATLAHHLWWKRHVAPDHSVRAAWFGVMARIVERFGAQFADKYGTRLVRTAVGGTETDPLAAAHRWDCLLVFMHHVQDWHNYLEKKELFAKRILDMLENGGWGDARQLSALLLPLLANMPPETLTDQFYATFFEALLAGLENMAVQSSRSELHAWVEGVEECVQYVAQREGGEAAASAAQRRWVRAALGAAMPVAACCARAMARLLTHWLRRADDHPRFDNMFRNFWHNINATLDERVAALATERERIPAAVETHVAFLIALDDGAAPQPLTSRAVKFADEASAEAKVPPRHAESALGESALRRYRHSARAAAHHALQLHLRLAAEARVAPALMPPLLPLVERVASEEAFAAIGGARPVFERTVCEWLPAEDMRCRALVDLAFLALAYLPDEERSAAFAVLDEMPVEAVEWGVERAAAGRCELAAQWADASPTVTAALIALAERATVGEERAAALVVRCVARACDAEWVRAVCVRVAGSVEARGPHQEACVAFAARLLDAGGDCDLAFTLFEVLLDSKERAEGEGAWAEGARAAGRALRAAGDHMVARAFAAVHCRLGLGSDEADDIEVSPPDSGPELRVSADDATGRGTESLLEQIEQAVCLMGCVAMGEAAVWRRAGGGGAGRAARSVEVHAVRADVVRAALSCPLEQEDGAGPLDPLTRSQYLRFIKACLFEGTMVRAALQAVGDHLLADHGALHHLSQLLYHHMVVRTLHYVYTFWEHYDLIEDTAPKFESILKDIIAGMSTQTKRDVLEYIAARAAVDGYYWAYAHNYYKEFVESPQCEQRERSHGEEGEEGGEWRRSVTHLVEAARREPLTGNGLVHTAQARGDTDAPYLCAVRALCLQWSAELVPRLAHSSAPSALLDTIIDTYYQHNKLMLYETDVSEASWAAAMTNVSVLELLLHEVEGGGWAMPAHHWDFVNLTLSALLNSAEKSKHAWGECKVAAVSAVALRLFVSVARFVRDVPARAQREEPSPHVAHLPAEWDDIFAPDTHTSIFALILHVLESDEATIDSPRATVVAALLEACGELRWERLPAAHRRPEHTQRLWAGAARTLTAPRPLPYKYLAYDALALLIDTMVLDDAERLAAWSDIAASLEESKAPPPPTLSLHTYADTLLPAARHLHAALDHLRVLEETVSPRAGSPLEAECAGVLLLADVLHRHIARARHDLTQHYYRIYREGEYAEPVVCAAFRLLPARVLPAAETGAAPAEEAAFEGVGPRRVFGGRGAVTGALACAAVCGAARGPGAVWLRAWRGAAPARASSALEHVVARHVTPVLVREELARVARHSTALLDAEVRCNAAARTAWCRLEVDGRVLELTVVMGRSHPLTTPEISAPPPAHRTHWLVLYVGYQGGSVWGAIRLWAEGVSRRVERSPQCYICYCRLHPTNGQLPSVTCHQCKNKFHDRCLHKWFATSKKSNCPLCRGKF